jgi:hypothetical protein
MPSPTAGCGDAQEEVSRLAGLEATVFLPGVHRMDATHTEAHKGVSGGGGLDPAVRWGWPCIVQDAFVEMDC